MRMLHTFLSTYEEIGKYFKDSWVTVNPNDPMTFMSDTKNEENKQDDSDNIMIEVQVCAVGAWQKMLLMR